jgi:hypothetical protein
MRISPKTADKRASGAFKVTNTAQEAQKISEYYF